MDKNQRQAGAVSLFAVIFAALLLTILTVGFIKLMLRDQQQATHHDLSQSAYDAALAGVEDAKRVIRACQRGVGRACAALSAALDCQLIARSGVIGGAGDKETLVRSSHASGERFDQAYTCVKLAMNTEDYLYEARDGVSQLVPLRAVAPFNRVVIEWHTQADTDGGVLGPPRLLGGDELPSAKQWDRPAPAPPAPSLLRAQTITPGARFRLQQLDETAASSTFFFRPIAVSDYGLPATVQTADTARATGGGEYGNHSTAVTCSGQFGYGGYACRAEIVLPEVAVAASDNAFLRLTTLYKTSQARVRLMHGDSPVLFRSVQPSVDVTGRASYLFRRVEARIQLGDAFPYPERAVDITYSICKDFSVTETAARPGACRP